MRTATLNKRAAATIAVLIASHNRRDVTVRCLRALNSQDLPEDTRISVFLVDDGSTDGTAAAVRGSFHGATVVDGGGSLFWNGAMALAWRTALEGRFDFYLWLNDDTVLYRDAIRRALGTYEVCQFEQKAHVIVVGTTIDPLTSRHSYGGRNRRRRAWGLHTDLVTPGATPVECETMNGNFVLVPAQIVHSIGILDTRYRHIFGDLDYGFRAMQAGGRIVIVPGVVGECRRNASTAAWLDPARSFKERWAAVTGPKALYPRSSLTYCRRFGGPLWPLKFITPYARVILSSIWWRLRRGVQAAA
jgi:GT2 family glycosyltransferase